MSLQTSSKSQVSAPTKSTPPGYRPRRARAHSVLADGQPMIWLTGGALAIGLLMVAGLLALVVYQGLGTFWPRPVVEVVTEGGQRFLGQVAEVDRYEPDEAVIERLSPVLRDAARALQAEQGGELTRWQIRTGNYEDTESHYDWVTQVELLPSDVEFGDVESSGTEGDGRQALVEWDAGHTQPDWAMVVEREENGRFYGYPVALLEGGQVIAEGPEAVWDAIGERHDGARELWRDLRHIDRHEIGPLQRSIEDARLGARQEELDHGAGSPQAVEAWAEFERTRSQIEADVAELGDRRSAVEEAGSALEVRFDTAYGTTKDLPLWEIVRAVPVNRLSVTEKLGVYIERWGEFLSADPREANSEGGVFPAIFGTVVMTLVMSLAVVPFGVLAALYLREYAKPGPLVSFVRIAVNNLAGVPSIVFGVFGLGFFCYIVGASIDELLFEARLPNPTYGTGGVLWASLTLALLTLPVVIVATEEALAAVPSSMREGSYACGATKWQTIRRIVLPRAMPGIMTGMILAIARGAGEVAPLMLVGAVKLAPELPIDGSFPYIHPERSFMHLGFHIYDLGFQSQNSEAAKPMVFTTTLLLILIVVLLNIAAIWIRARLRRRFVA